MNAPFLSETMPGKKKSSNSRTKVNTIEPNLEDAALLVNKLRNRLTERGNRRLLQAFTALADGDRAVGILAFYLWRRKARRRT